MQTKAIGIHRSFVMCFERSPLYWKLVWRLDDISRLFLLF